MANLVFVSALVLSGEVPFALSLIPVISTLVGLPRGVLAMPMAVARLFDMPIRRTFLLSVQDPLVPALPMQQALGVTLTMPELLEVP